MSPVSYTHLHDTPAYYAKLRELDGYVGRIVDAIKEAGIYENSIIIVTARCV